MINPNINAEIPANTTRECLVELNKLVPKNEAELSRYTNDQKSVMQGKIGDLLKKVLTNEKSFAFEQRSNLTNISDLTKKAEKMHLLSNEGREVVGEIAVKAKTIGLSLYTGMRCCTLQTTDGPVEFSGDLLAENSGYFKEMIETFDGTEISFDVELSKKALEYLQECLSAPKLQRLKLPKDKTIIPQLLSFGAKYEFETFMKKMELLVTPYVRENYMHVLENKDTWSDVSNLVQQTKPDVNWLEDAKTRFLKHLKIPLKEAEDNQDLYVVPVSHLTCFYKEETRDAFRALDPVIEINNENELKTFLENCEQHKMENPLPIKLQCWFDYKESPEATELKKSILTVAEASNIQVTFEKKILPPHTTIFGKEHWEKYFGFVGKTPPLPEGIAELLESPCPFFKGGYFSRENTWKETHMLVLIPKTFNGIPLNLNNFIKLVQHPMGGGYPLYVNHVPSSVMQLYGDIEPEETHWALVSMNIIGETEERSHNEQEAIIARVPNAKVVDLRSGAIGLFANYTHTGESSFSVFDWFTCQETIGDNAIRIGIGVGKDVVIERLNTRKESALQGVRAIMKF